MENSTKEYQRFGRRTLVMLILEKSLPAVFSLFILAVLFASPDLFPDEYAAFSSMVLPIVFFVFIFTILIALLSGWLEYRNYSIFFDENNFKVRRGAWNVEEIGVPYRHVREVKIRRSIIDQLAGVSNVIISKVQDEDGRLAAEEEKIVLSLIDQATAALIQNTILKKTEIEKMAIISSK